MANTDQYLTGAGRGLFAPPRDIVNRLLLCSVVAGLEGVVALALVFGVALGYHLGILVHPLASFDALLYLAYGLLGAMIYATFAALDCSRFLDGRTSADVDIRQSFLAWTTSIALVLLAAFLLGRVGDFSRVSLTVAYVAGVPVMIALRRLLHGLIADRISDGHLHYGTIAVVGNRADVLSFLLHGELGRQGHRLQGTLFFEDARDADGKVDAKVVSAFAAELLKRGTKHIVLAGSVNDLDAFDGVVAELKRYALNLLYAPSLQNRSLKFLDVIAVGPNNVLRFVRTPMSDFSVLLKRVFDIVLSALGLLLLAPLLGLVALAIVLESRGPALYLQARRGFNGDTFMILKFRSMRVAESGYAMSQATKDDPRITRVGRFIRATSIDELPQLLNVLLGQMSLVGPRPHAISHDEELSRELASYAHRQRIRPGITGWAQVNGYRGETSERAQIEGRVAHDIYYIDNWSLLFDIWILVLTVVSPTTRTNAR